MTKTKCKKHPDYHGIRKPLSDCLDCWKMYSERLEERLAGKPAIIKSLESHKLKIQ